MRVRPRFRVVDGGSLTPAATEGYVSAEEAFRTFSPYVASIGLRLLGRSHEVEDLVQDVFLSAHRGLRSLREPAAVKNWLAAVTVRLARRRLRMRRVRMVLGLEEDYDYSAVLDPGLSPEDRALLADVYRLLDTLPPRVRLAWTLRVLQQERLERVADLCGCSLATAKRCITAANVAITERFGDG